MPSFNSVWTAFVKFRLKYNILVIYRFSILSDLDKFFVKSSDDSSLAKYLLNIYLKNLVVFAS